MNRTRFLCLIFFFNTIVFTYAQTTVITATIKGLNTPKVSLGYYLGGEVFAADSVLVDTVLGAFTFRTQGLKPGLMVVYTDRGRLFNFILPTPADSFDIKGDVLNLSKFEVSGSVEQVAYFNFIASTKPLEDAIEQKQTMYEMISQATRGDNTELAPIEASILRNYNSIDSLSKSYVKSNPNHLFALMLKSVTAPEPPANMKQKENGRTTATYFYWLRNHYWDNTNFKDDRLVRNNLWQSYFDGYFRRMVSPGTDSLLVALDKVIGLMPQNGGFYQFALSRLVKQVEQNNAPGADNIFVHIADHYLKKDNTPWLDAATLERIEYKASVNRPVLTGIKAPPLELADDSLKIQNLYAVEAPITMLVFYSPLCEHCMDIMPNLYQIYLDFQSTGLKVVAVNADEQYNYWKQFQKQQNWTWIDLADPNGKNEFEKQYITFNLPVIYLLDKDKRILMKRPNLENLREILAEMLKN